MQWAPPFNIYFSKLIFKNITLYYHIINSQIPWLLRSRCSTGHFLCDYDVSPPSLQSLIGLLAFVNISPTPTILYTAIEQTETPLPFVTRQYLIQTRSQCLYAVGHASPSLIHCDPQWSVDMANAEVSLSRSLYVWRVVGWPSEQGSKCVTL